MLLLGLITFLRGLSQKAAVVDESIKACRTQLGPSPRSLGPVCPRPRPLARRRALFAASDVVSFPNGNTCVPSPRQGRTGQLSPTLHEPARCYAQGLTCLGLGPSGSISPCTSSWGRHPDSPGAPQRARVKRLDAELC